MDKILNIGLVIADPDEYSPITSYVEKFQGEEHSLFGLKCHSFVMPISDGNCRITSVLCGTGKVNAATATAFIIDRGADVIINTGLSGGVSGVSRGDIVLATKLLEHDFDLMCLGYAFAEKPSQEYIYSADEKLNAIYEGMCPSIKKGTMVAGDRFVNDSALRDKLKSEFCAIACDMESAAAAYVCHITDTPFAAVRRISDDAGEEATESYRSMNELAESCLLDIVLKGISRISSVDFQR